MEDLDIFVEEKDALVGRTKRGYGFPAVSFNNSNSSRYSSPCACFNAKCRPLLKDCRYMKLYKTAEYVVFSPQTTNEGTCFRLCQSHERLKMLSTAFAGWGVVGKTYKLYKCKQGFVIKLNKPLNKGNEVK